MTVVSLSIRQGALYYGGLAGGLGAPTGRRRGSALLIVMVFLLVLFTAGAALLDWTTSALVRGRRDLLRAQALDVAEAGAEKAIYYLRGTAPNGTTNGSWRTTGLTETLSGEGDYTISVADGTGDDAGKIVIVSTGTVAIGASSVTRRLRLAITREEEDISPWHNVIFAGVGQNGKSIDGNVIIRGGVHLLGDGEPYVDSNGNGVRDSGESYTDINGDGAYNSPLAATDTALDVGGTADVGNNYSGMSSTLRAYLPSIPTVTYGGESVQSLSGKLRVKHGRVDISGTATVGVPNVTGGSPAVKETMNASYVTNGFGGNKGSASAHADNGISKGYDLGNLSQFPDVVSSTTIGGTTYSSHMNYLAARGMTITGPLNLQPDQIYTRFDGFGNSITVDGLGHMAVNGIVYVNGDINLNCGHGSGNDTFTYAGRGTLSATGSIYVHTNVVPGGGFPSVSALGMIARHRLELATGSGDSQLKMVGAFYAQEQVVSQKQNEIGGTFVSSYFSMQNVPAIYYVPTLADNLPPGMPGSTSTWVITTQVKSWTEIAPA